MKDMGFDTIQIAQLKKAILSLSFLLDLSSHSISVCVCVCVRACVCV